MRWSGSAHNPSLLINHRYPQINNWDGSRCILVPSDCGLLELVEALLLSCGVGSLQRAGGGPSIFSRSRSLPPHHPTTANNKQDSRRQQDVLSYQTKLPRQRSLPETKSCYERRNGEWLNPDLLPHDAQLRHEGEHLPTTSETRRRCFLCSHKHRIGYRGGGLNVRT